MFASLFVVMGFEFLSIMCHWNPNLGTLYSLQLKAFITETSITVLQELFFIFPSTAVKQLETSYRTKYYSKILELR